MTTSFINDKVDQELELTDLQNMNGGTVGSALIGVGLGMLVGAEFVLIIDLGLRRSTGKGIWDHVEEAMNPNDQPTTESGGENNGGNVAPTGDGKGCIDRGLPI